MHAHCTARFGECLVVGRYNFGSRLLGAVISLRCTASGRRRLIVRLPLVADRAVLILRRHWQVEPNSRVTADIGVVGGIEHQAGDAVAGQIAHDDGHAVFAKDSPSISTSKEWWRDGMRALLFGRLPAKTHVQGSQTPGRPASAKIGYASASLTRTRAGELAPAHYANELRHYPLAQVVPP